MEPELRKERQIDFLKTMVDADAELLQFVANWMHTNLTTFGVELPWEQHCKTCKTKLEQPLKGTLAVQYGMTAAELVQTADKVVITGGVHKHTEPKWIEVLSAPQVKAKAYNPISLHIAKGAKVKLKNGTTGTAKGFTKHFVKVLSDLSGTEIKKLYNNVTHVAVP